MPLDRHATLKQAEKLLRRGKLDGAIDAYVRVVAEHPRDWSSINALGDLYARAGDGERAVAQFTRVADHLFDEGFYPRAAALYKKALRVQAQDEHALSRLVETAVRQGLLVDAKHYLRQLEEVRQQRGDGDGVTECRARLAALEETDPAPMPADAAAASASTAEDDPTALFSRARRELAGGDERQARAMLTRVLALDPGRHDDVQRLALDLARGGRTESAAECVNLVVDAALLVGDGERAVGALEQFAGIVSHIPSLIRLVEVCVEGGLDQPLRAAQARLVDAYLAAERADDARALVQELLEADPDDEAHADRLDRALEILGAPTELPERTGDAPTPEVEVDLTDALATVGASASLASGDPERALKAATRNPRTRAKASAELGRLYLQRGDLRRGIEWLERAADSPATPDEGLAVLYDLADALERAGEPARALAILIGLEFDARGYRDIRVRIDRLARTQPGSPS